MKQIYFVILIIIFAVSLVSVVFTNNQVNQEKESLTIDLQYRTALIADSLKEIVESNYILRSSDYFQTIVEMFANRERFAGFAIYDNNSQAIAISSSLTSDITEPPGIITSSLGEDKVGTTFINLGGKYSYLLSVPFYQNDRISGALLIAQDADFIDEKIIEIWKTGLSRLFIQDLILFIVLTLIGRWLVYEPLLKLETSLKTLKSRTDGTKLRKKIGPSIFHPLQKEISVTIKKLWEARQSASEEARLSLEKLDSPWTKEKLKEFVKKYLLDRQIIMISNREPFIHTKEGKKIGYYIPASGMVTAIDPIMQACGGIWVAHGSGNADKLMVDKKDHVLVPPDEPKYTLKRIWLTEQEVKGYYLGFSNEGMWPLFHLAHTRPIFRMQDWEEYQRVNEKFAQVVLSEIHHMKKPLLLVQDFHLALLPRMIKNRMPEVTIGIFWHIPWVSPEMFSICPWKKEILDGILGADLVGFHTQQYCNNFIESVGRELESLINYNQLTIIKNEHLSLVKSFPISIAFTNGIDESITDDTSAKNEKNPVKRLGIQSKYLGVGVDRMDYTKGILERLKGIEIFLHQNPAYVGEFVFIQIAAPSRGEVEKYRQFAQDVQQEVERINSLFQKNNWKPVILLNQKYSHEQINLLFQESNFCLVTSLHDGMNLVAKEFVAARNDGMGVLILSQFTGAAQELKDALIVNPYNGAQTAEAIHQALIMTPAEQKSRMNKMRETIKNYNIYRWSAEFLKSLVNLD